MVGMFRHADRQADPTPQRATVWRPQAGLDGLLEVLLQQTWLLWPEESSSVQACGVWGRRRCAWAKWSRRKGQQKALNSSTREFQVAKGVCAGKQEAECFWNHLKHLPSLFGN